MATINREYVPVKEGYQLRLVFQSKSRIKRKVLPYFKVSNKFFDKGNKTIKRTLPTYKFYMEKLSELDLFINQFLFDIQFNTAIEVEELRDQFTQSYFSTNIKIEGHNIFLFRFANEYIEELKKTGKYGNARSFKYAMLSFSKYRLHQDIKVIDLTPVILSDYKNYLLGLNRLKHSSIMSYLSKLKSVYNLAIDRYDIDKKSPFKKGLITKSQYEKRNIELEAVKTFLNLSPLTKTEQLLVDLYMLTFYLRGHDLIDVVSIKEEDIKNGRIIFRRAKLKSKVSDEISIKIEPEAQRIFDKYYTGNSIYYLPFLKYDINSEIGYKYYHKTFYGKLSASRGELRKKFDLKHPYGFKTTRHTWASIARKNGIGYDIIKKCLGHKNTDITSVYLDYDDQQLDDANRFVIDLLYK